MPSALAYRAGEFVARRAPAPLTRAGARAAALAAAAASSSRRTLVRRNLERALERPLGTVEAGRRTAAVFGWYARYYLESFELPGLDAATVDAGFGYEGVDALERAVRSGTGPILVMPHLGTWEWAAWWLAQIPEMKVTAVVEPLEPPEVFEWFISFRRRLGMDIIPVGPDAAGRVAAAIKRGDVSACCLTATSAGEGWRPASSVSEHGCRPGPRCWRCARGAPLIPAAVYWRGSTRHAIARPPLDTSRHGRFRDDVSRVVQDYATALEGLIRVAPDQWHLMAPNWPSDYEALGLPIPESLRDL